MYLLNPRHEIFCVNFAISGRGTDAARVAGYDPKHAANQAHRLLKRADVQARLAELAAEMRGDAEKRAAEREAQRARLAALRATEAEAMIAKLDPVYEALLDDCEYQEVMKVISLQAEIAGHLHADDEAPRRSRRGVRPRQDSSSDDERIV